MVIGVIEVLRFRSSAMTLPKICDEFFVQLPHMMEHREPVVMTLADHGSDAFLGSDHAEATLMQTKLWRFRTHGQCNRLSSQSWGNCDCC